MASIRSRALLGAFLLLIVGHRAWRIDQPIVENYVGRQVPTAMVARNLERGSGFLAPQLDTGPFPNLFLVEPPLYETAVVALRRTTGMALGPTGRAVSAIGIALAAWGLFGLAWRRNGESVAWLSIVVFALLPVTIRYGRAFQPDALMLGAMVAGLRCWDEAESAAGTRSLRWRVAGVVFLSMGLALKIVSAYVLVPLVLVVLRTRPWWKVGLVASTLVPVLLWYAHAASLMNTDAGSLASADNGRIWLQTLVPTALLDISTWRVVGWSLCIRVFTPLGLALGIAGLLPGGRPDGGPVHLWLIWSASALGMLLMLAGKLHHEYYWLALSPVIAVGVAKALLRIGRQGQFGPLCAAATGTAFAFLSVTITASTWETPAEWAALPAAAAAVRVHVAPGGLIVAPEALIYESDRKGCRLEFGERAASRAAGEWRGLRWSWNSATGALPSSQLVEFYRRAGARYLADLGDAAGGDERLALHASIRRRYAVLVDRPEVFVADLFEPAAVESDP